MQMSLRFYHCKSNIFETSRHVSICARVPVKRFRPSTCRHIQTAHGSSQEADPVKTEKQRDGSKHQKPPRGSFRPLTGFFICIPIGWGAHWVLKRRDGDWNSASSDGFVRYTLTKKDAVSSTCAIFTLTPKSADGIDTSNLWADRAIKSVTFKQPQLQIARSYTLLPPAPEQDPRDLRFLIRKEHKGEVSGYLHRLPIGAEVELRGFHTDYILPEHVDQVVFIAGGTGVVPAMQVASILDGEAEVRLLWANRQRDECVGGESDTNMLVDTSWRTLFGLLTKRDGKARNDEASSTPSALVEALQRLKSQQVESARSLGRKTLMVDYYVDAEGTFIRREDVVHHLRAAQTSSTKTLVLVSGPEGFVSYWAGPKQWADGGEVQGPLGGILGQLQETELKGCEVVKL